MTSWDPGDGGRGGELLIHGDEKPPTRPGRQFAAAVGLLVLGAVGGAVVNDNLSRPGRERSHVALTGGVVAPAPRIDDRPRYRVGLFNSGEAPIRVRVVGVVGRSAAVTDSRPLEVAPHSWGQPVFSLPSECGEPELPLVTELRVRATGAGGSAEQRVALAEPATALRTVHGRDCVPPTLLSRRDLGGLWILEQVEGLWTGLAKVGLMRFTRDGRFTFDPEGQLFHEGHQGYFGTYRLDGTRLRLVADGGYACSKGFTEVWTTTLLAKGRLRLDVVSSDDGYCHSPPGERWFFRRLVRERLLPPVGPVSGRTP